MKAKRSLLVQQNKRKGTQIQKRIDGVCVLVVLDENHNYFLEKEANDREKTSCPLLFCPVPWYAAAAADAAAATASVRESY